MHRILIIQTAFLGDVVLATALVEKLHQHFPNAKIDFLLRKGNESLLKGHPFLHEVLIFNKKEKTKSLRQLVRQMRSNKYDLVVNVQRFFSSGLLAVLSGGKQIVGFDKNPLSFGYSRKIKHEIGGEGKTMHEVERNLRLVEHLTDATFVRPKLYPAATAYEKVPQQETFVTMAPTSVWFTKQWPAEKWVELIRHIPDHTTVYLLGGPSDKEACQHILDTAGRSNVHNMAGKLSLLDSAALMEKAVMNYANDSAPIHLASAVNAPITAVFCSTVPAFGFTPLSDNAKVVETTEALSCRPCGLHGHKACPEGHFKCADIAIGSVY